MSSLIDLLSTIAREDAEGLTKAQESYGDSWCKRGGVGAFMMLARKWDRMEKRVEEIPARYDIFEAIRTDERAEGIIDDVRDLRRYLMLVEAKCRALGYPSAQSKHRDNAAPPLEVPPSPPGRRPRPVDLFDPYA